MIFKKQVFIAVTLVIVALLISTVGIGPVMKSMIHHTDTPLQQQHQINATITMNFVEILYNKTFTTSQQHLQLNHEYVQYEIMFSKKDTIDVSIDMSYSADSADTLFYVVYLTNGLRELTSNMTLHYEKAINKYSEESKSFSGTFDVQKNENWYLLIAVYQKATETINVNIQSTEASIDIISIQRNNKMDYYTIQSKEFEGKRLQQYHKLGIVGYGISYCNVKKTIPITKGMLIYCNVDNFLVSEITYYYPGNERPNMALSGNHFYEASERPGDWVITMQCLGLPKTSVGSLFYIDINPHGQMNFDNIKKDYQEQKTPNRFLMKLMKNITIPFFNICIKIFIKFLNMSILLFNTLKTILVKSLPILLNLLKKSIEICIMLLVGTGIINKS